MDPLGYLLVLIVLVELPTEGLHCSSVESHRQGSVTSLKTHD